jgi:hypothetical protein
MNKETILIKDVNLTNMVKFLNETFGNKPSGKPFKKEDVQQYCIKTGQLPEYLGNIEVRRNKKIESVKLYDLVRIE